MEKPLTSFNVVMTQLVINKQFWEDEGGSSLLTSGLPLRGVSGVSQLAWVHAGAFSCIGETGFLPIPSCLFPSSEQRRFPLA